MNKFSDLEDLSPEKFDKVLCCVLDIKEKLQTTQSDTVEIESSFTNSSELIEDEYKRNLIGKKCRREALKYLRRNGAIKTPLYKTDIQALHTEFECFVSGDAELINPETCIVTVYRNAFNQFAKHIKALAKQKHIPWIHDWEEEEEEEPVITGDEQYPVRVDDDPSVVYRVFFRTSGEILINNIQLSKPNFDSDNYNVFHYLFWNPNRKVTRKELVDKYGAELQGKDFHKMLDNLNFKGELRKVFFETSKNSIRFNNPITVNKLKDIGITWIKLPKN